VSGWNASSIRQLERSSIQKFLETCGPYLKGRVLDYGCGQQPYRKLVESFEGEYHGYDRADHPGSVTEGEDVGEWPFSGSPWDSILCTQVMQFFPTRKRNCGDHDVVVSGPGEALMCLHWMLKDGGFLVLTYTTNWDEVEEADHTRFTKTGMEHMLSSIGFEILKHERRAEINLGGFEFPLGYGCVAQR